MLPGPLAQRCASQLRRLARAGLIARADLPGVIAQLEALPTEDAGPAPGMAPHIAELRAILAKPGPIGIARCAFCGADASALTMMTGRWTCRKCGFKL